MVLYIILICFWSSVALVLFCLALFQDTLTFAPAMFSALPSLLMSIFLETTSLFVFLQFFLFFLLFAIFWISSFWWIRKRNRKFSKQHVLSDSLYDYGRVIENIPQKTPLVLRYGLVKIQGKLFRALSLNKEGTIKVGEEIKVIEVKGNILIVARK